jgi:CRP-like cAMP-binding protein
VNNQRFATNTPYLARVVKAGTVVFREGEFADCAYVVERGQLEVRKRTEAAAS